MHVSRAGFKHKIKTDWEAWYSDQKKKIATLNLCLGLKNKKDLVKDILISNEIDILVLQEIELENNFDCNVLNIPGFILETENTGHKKRVGMYVTDKLASRNPWMLCHG